MCIKRGRSQDEFCSIPHQFISVVHHLHKMQALVLSLAWIALTIGGVNAVTNESAYHSISVDAGIVIGTLKNLQGTNNAKVRKLTYALLQSPL